MDLAGLLFLAYWVVGAAFLIEIRHYLSEIAYLPRAGQIMAVGLIYVLWLPVLILSMLNVPPPGSKGNP
jgi:hypothetical protein